MEMLEVRDGVTLVQPPYIFSSTVISKEPPELLPKGMSSTQLEKVSSEQLGDQNRFTVRGYRHMAIAFGRRFMGSKQDLFKECMEGDDPFGRDMDEDDDTLDFQAGHTTRTAERVYTTDPVGRDRGDNKDVQEDDWEVGLIPLRLPGARVQGDGDRNELGAGLGSDRPGHDSLAQDLFRSGSACSARAREDWLCRDRLRC
ncbi:hypothetical protein QBC38DRAFT_549639 [Podospora fimiseda]|uniref:Uncharacterized protein n=1 Tax=Podospora fimiseda TaxID=252190 RepID=A0AAN6YNC1_9PEZI|nr:hypothetical protein QBC38DRAFT_549639 [Podospora fimiseda]